MSGFRTGVMDSGIFPRFAADLLLRNSRQLAVAGGADSFWLPDHLTSLVPSSIWAPKHAGGARIAPRVNGCVEPWTALGYVAARNRVTRLRLGVGVTDAGRRNPAVTAHAAATLHLLNRGRSILGIGTGERENNEPYGVDWSTPVARLEEALATIRLLWNSDGTPVNRDSAHFPLRDAVFDVPPHKGSRPEIWVAAHGPRMLRVTGRHADAWLPVLSQRPSIYEDRLNRVRAAASDSGRDPMAITPAMAFWMMTSCSRDAVDEMVGSLVGKSTALWAPADTWSRHGVEHPLGPSFTGLQDLLPQHIDEQTAIDYLDRVPPSLVREVCLCGTPAEIVDQISEWRNHGLRYAVLMPMSAVHPKTRVGLGSFIPVVQILRRLKRL